MNHKAVARALGVKWTSLIPNLSKHQLKDIVDTFIKNVLGLKFGHADKKLQQQTYEHIVEDLRDKAHVFWLHLQHTLLLSDVQIRYLTSMGIEEVIRFLARIEANNAESTVMLKNIRHLWMAKTN